MGISSVTGNARLSGASLTMDVVSAVVCPWCFIGKRRLEKALALLGRENVQIRWKAFQLNPGAPKPGMDRRTYRLRKFGSAEYAQQLEARVAAAGTEEGIHFRFDRIERIPNTFDAHRLIWLAGSGGVQNDVVEKLFHAYFIDGEDVGSPGILKRIGAESGLDSGALDQLFAGDRGAAEVTAEEAHARTQGVNGVPAFFVNGAPIASGAQKPEVLASIFGPALDLAGQRCSVEDGACS